MASSLIPAGGGSSIFMKIALFGGLLLVVLTVILAPEFLRPSLDNSYAKIIQEQAEAIASETKSLPRETKLTGVASGSQAELTLVKPDGEVSSVPLELPMTRGGTISVKAEGTLEAYTLSWTTGSLHEAKDWRYDSLTGEVTLR